MRKLCKKLSVSLIALSLIFTGGADIALCFSETHAGDAAIHSLIHNDTPLLESEGSRGCDPHQFNNENCCIDIYLAAVGKNLRIPLNFQYPVIFSTGVLLHEDDLAILYHQYPDSAATIPVPSPPIFIQTRTLLN